MYFFCANISAQKFVKSEPSPLDISFLVINSRFKLACIAWQFIYVACARAQTASQTAKLRRLESNKLWYYTFLVFLATRYRQFSSKIFVHNHFSTE